MANTAPEPQREKALTLALTQIEKQFGKGSIMRMNDECFVRDIDVIVLNIREQAVADARLSLIAAQADFFTAEADLQAALGIDPDVVAQARP